MKPESFEHATKESSESREILKIPIDVSHYISIRKESPDKPFLDISIKNTKTGESILNLRDSAPTKISFAGIVGEGEENFAADPKNGWVYVPIQGFINPADIFSLLHEVGHITIRNKEYDQNPARAKIKTEARLISEFLTDPEANSIVLQDEREAWTEAIKIARRWKKEYNLDLFALFPKKNDFMSWLRVRGLRSYEHAIERIKIAAYSRDKKTREWFEQHKEEFPEKFKKMFGGDAKTSQEKIIEDVVEDTTDSFFLAAADLKKEFEEKLATHAKTVA